MKEVLHERVHVIYNVLICTYYIMCEHVEFQARKKTNKW